MEPISAEDRGGLKGKELKWWGWWCDNGGGGLSKNEKPPDGSDMESVPDSDDPAETSLPPEDSRINSDRLANEGIGALYDPTGRLTWRLTLGKSLPKSPGT